MSSIIVDPLGLKPSELGASKAMLGPFELLQPIAEGGMGQVWLARHRAQDVQVAIKVLTEEWAQTKNARSSFRNEVRAQAKLDHPGICMPFEQGVVTRVAAQQAETVDWYRGPQRHRAGRQSKVEPFLDAGSPWLAMEYAPYGSLNQLGLPMNWGGIRGLLLSLLDALAHAHARGVIHRDLKPENLLVFRRPLDELGAPTIKVSDFGVAHAFREQDEGMRISGTPHYMAPEQFLGRFRDQGPWTDLYAVGCIAYELVAGSLPFTGDSLTDLGNAHLMHDVPPLPEGCLVPKGFDEWLGRMLQKSIRHRFRWAADAAWALLAMGEPEHVASVIPHQGRGLSRSTYDLHEGFSTLAWVPKALATMPDELFEENAGVADALTGPGPALDELPKSPPLPIHWTRPELPAPSMQLVGAGIGLFGVRTVRMVGRTDEQDHIWSMLREVNRTRRARLAVLHGPTGTGKTRLADWAAQRFHEVGAGTVYRVQHRQGGGSGLKRMLTDELGCGGLNAAETAARIEASFANDGVTNPFEAQSMAAFVSGEDVNQSRKQGWTHRPEENFALIRRHMIRSAGERLLLLFFDDVQWSTESISFIRFLMQNQDMFPVPALIVVTARDEEEFGAELQNQTEGREPDSEHDSLMSLSHRIKSGVSQTQMESFGELPGARRISVGPLGRVEISALIRQLLGMSSELAKEVEERAAGNALFAVELVGDWVRRGVLEPGRHGFTVRTESLDILPDNIHQVWFTRIRRLVRGRPPQYLHALEIAAFLGQDVDELEWSRACEAKGISCPDDLADGLGTERLWIEREGGWAFAHSMLRQSVLREARENGRSRSHHQACAAALKEVYETASDGVAERYGRHLIGAGDWPNSIDPLYRGAKERFYRGELEAALALTQLSERAMTRGQASESDVRWGEIWLLRGKTMISLGRMAQATATAHRVSRLARTHGWSVFQARAVRQLGYVAQRRGELLRARALFQQSLDLHEKAGDELGVAGCLVGLSQVVSQRGELERARELVIRGLEIYEEYQKADGIGRSLRELADIAMVCGDIDEADTLLSRALECFRTLGDLVGRASCLNGLGNVARLRGNVEESERLYLESIKCFETAGSPDSNVVLLHCAILRMDANRFDEAQTLLDRAATVFERLGRRSGLGCVHVLKMLITAQEHDWETWERHHVRAERLLADTGMADPDLARVLARVGEEAARAKRFDLATISFEMAISQWSVLGAAEEVRNTVQKMGALVTKPDLAVAGTSSHPESGQKEA